MKKLVLIFVIAAIFYSPQDAYTQIIDHFKTKPKAERVMLKVEDLWYSGKTKKALALISENIDKSPNTKDYYILRSNMHLVLGDIDSAIADASALIRIYPDDVLALRSRAYLQTRLNNLDKAFEDLQKAKQLAPKDIRVRSQIAVLNSQLKDYKSAENELLGAIAIDSSDSEALLDYVGLLNALNRHNEAYDRLKQHIANYLSTHNGKLPQMFPENISKNKQMFLQANKAFEVTLKRYSVTNLGMQLSDEAIIIALQKNEKARSLAKVFVMLGATEITRGSYAEALNYLNKSLEINSNEENAYGIRGKMFFDQKKYKKAITDFNSAIKRIDISYLYIYRGLSYLAIGNSKKAEENFDVHQKLFPSYSDFLQQTVRTFKIQNGIK